jgi:hypothetical protein
MANESVVPSPIVNILIAGCVQVAVDGKQYVERAVDVGQEPEFFSVYAQDEDGIWTCLSDHDDEPAAKVEADRLIQANGIRRSADISA